MTKLTNEVKEMQWVDFVAYAKSLGINPYHKTRVELEEEIEGLDYIQTAAGDFGYDRYYPGLYNEDGTKSMSIKQAYLVLIRLSSYRKTYVANRLSGNLSKHNGRITGRLSVIRGVIFGVLKDTKDAQTKERIDYVLKSFVDKGYMDVDYSINNVPQYFIVKDKCNEFVANYTNTYINK